MAEDLIGIEDVVINVENTFDDILRVASCGKFYHKMYSTISSDIEVNMRTGDFQEVFDVIISMNQPSMSSYDIIVSPFVTMNFNNFDAVKKGDNPFDFMITDTEMINEKETVVMKALGRDLKYFTNKSDEFNKPLGNVDEYKPITQNVLKSKINPRFYCMKLKNKRDINLNSSWFEGAILTRYKNFQTQPSHNHKELIGRFDSKLIKRYGTTNITSIPRYLDGNSLNVMSFWLYVSLEDTWFFKLESSESAQLLIDNKLIIENYNTDTTENAESFEYRMSEGFYKFVIRSENTRLDSNFTLKFTNRNSISWKELTNINLNSEL